MKIHVTKEHILKGRQAAAQQCPVALAIKEATCAPYVGVTHHSVNIGNDWQSGTIYPFNKEVTNFIKNFDMYGMVGVILTPISFELNIEKYV